MTLNRVKLFTITLFVLPVIALAIFNTKPIGTIVSAADAAETYKTKCAMCHSPKAEKLFDSTKTDEVLTEIIMKGKKGEKPPFMPGFEAKGMTADEAKALIIYMRKLKNPDAPVADKKDTAEPKTEKDVAKDETDKKSREAIIAAYKTSCAACHGLTAEKLFDPTKTAYEQAQIILKGKKGAKPPFMPGFEAKGTTLEEANALAAYMIELRTPVKK
jgi:mono/diheme cytochrome c family protein